MIPALETAKRFTDESVRMVVKAERIFLNSQTFTVRSSEPEMTLSSRVKTVDVTLLQEIEMKNSRFNVESRIQFLANGKHTLCVPGKPKLQILDHGNPKDGM